MPRKYQPPAEYTRVESWLPTMTIKQSAVTPSPPLQITLLVCTRNGSRTLDECLRTCLAEVQRNGAPPAEVIVVDNGSTDTTPAILEKSARHNPRWLRVLHASEPGKNHAFEAGVRAARGEIVAIIDDDNYIGPEYLTHVAAFFRDYPAAGVVGSLNRLDESVVAPDWFPWAKDLLACERPLIADRVTVDDRGREIGDLGYIAGAGMAFLKRPLLDAWDSGYRFFSNTNRQAGITGEDIELCFLLRSMGFRFGFDPQMHLRHDIAAARLTPAAFWELCEMVGAGSLGLDPFLFTTKHHGTRASVKWRWSWQLLAKVKRWALSVATKGGTADTADERRFRRRRERHQCWGAVRHLAANRERYTRHVRQVASGAWTRLRVR